MTPNGWTVRWGPRGQIEAADAVSAREIWVVGSTSAGSRESGLVARWDGHDWVLARRFDRIDRFEDVVAPSSGAVWAVGGAYDPDANASRPYIARRLSGNWRIDWTRKSAGRVTAIDGTPHNLWTFLTYPPVHTPSCGASPRCIAAESAVRSPRLASNADVDPARAIVPS